MALLSLRNVSLAFGGPRLLDQVELQIEQGERLCLLGRNGEGKSTLLRLIRGEIEPDEGEVIRQQGCASRSCPRMSPASGMARSPIRWQRDSTTVDIPARGRTIACRRSSREWDWTRVRASRTSPRE